MKLNDADWPLSGWQADMRGGLDLARQQGRIVVLGTIIGLSGSSPRPVGTQMLFDGMATSGYFSGGCLEPDVANHALTVQRDGKPLRLHYGKGSPWIDVRLVCGGALEIFLERIAPADSGVAALLDHAERREPATWQSDGVERAVGPMRLESSVYTLQFNPVWRLVIIGHDPTCLALVALARQAGFLTHVIWPDGADTPLPWADVAYSREQPEDALAALGIDAWTAVVAATHDDDIDIQALVSALGASTGYIGVLGSATRKPARIDKMRAQGISDGQIARLHSPIGQVRCGKSPWEVAVSVMAEIMECRNATDAIASLKPVKSARLLSRQRLHHP